MGTGAGTDFLNFLAAGQGTQGGGGSEGFWAWRSLLVPIYGLLTLMNTVSDYDNVYLSSQPP